MREKETAMLRKWHNKERRDCKEGESEIGPGDQLKLYSKGRCYVSKDVVGATASQTKPSEIIYAPTESESA